MHVDHEDPIYMGSLPNEWPFIFCHKSKAYLKKIILKWWLIQPALMASAAASSGVDV